MMSLRVVESIEYFVEICLHLIKVVFLKFWEKLKKMDSQVTIGTNSEASRRLLDNVITNSPNQKGVQEMTLGQQNLRRWLGKAFRVEITDGRTLVGYFNCTDRDANLVLSMCAEYLEYGKEARILGNVMIPGKHIVSISVDMPEEEAFSQMPKLTDDKQDSDK